MSEQRSSLQRSPRSLAEEQVLRGLEQLPPGYEVLTGSRLQIPEVPGGESTMSYEPDFEVRRPDGSRVVIEVKTGKSLSMVNLSRFVKFNELINAAGKSFLVLVWGGDYFPARLSAMPEFETLHIEAVHSSSDVLQAVQTESRK